MKKIKYISIFISLIISLFIFQKDVEAINSSISVTSSAGTVITGRTVNVSVTVSSSEPLGAWEYTLNYDTSKLRLNSGSQHVVDYGDGQKKTAVYNYSFTAIGTGSAYVSIGSYVLADYATESRLTPAVGSANINIITQQQLQATYSGNNYLSSLVVDGQVLSPEFNKENLEYSVELDYTIEKINISAIKEDNTASVDGIGEVAVSEGNNTINIVVTAQNGNIRTYVINALVKELNPIYVEVDGKKYSLVKKKDLLGTLNNYQEAVVTISGEEIPALKSDITNYTIVGLKDSEGKINLYIYDAENETYTKYNELTFNGIKLYYMENKDNNYKATKLKINEEEVTVYKKEDVKYYLIYGMNLETGKTGWYTYDEEESTIQKYVENNQKEVKEQNNQYLVLIIVLCSIIGLLFIFISILFAKYRKSLKTVKI